MSDSPHISLTKSILRSISASKRSAGMTASDFSDLGSPAAVRQALSRLVKQGRIGRAKRGVFYKPRPHPIAGRTGPDTLGVIRKLMERSAAEWQFSGATAANLLGLSEQVPARWVILTNGNSRRVWVGNMEVNFRHAAPRNFLGGGKPAGLVFQALRYIGAGKVTAAHITHLRNKLDDPVKKELMELLPDMPAWMQPVAREISTGEDQ